MRNQTRRITGVLQKYTSGWTCLCEVFLLMAHEDGLWPLGWWHGSGEAIGFHLLITLLLFFSRGQGGPDNRRKRDEEQKRTGGPGDKEEPRKRGQENEVEMRTEETKDWADMSGKRDELLYDWEMNWETPPPPPISPPLHLSHPSISQKLNCAAGFGVYSLGGWRNARKVWPPTSQILGAMKDAPQGTCLFFCTWGSSRVTYRRRVRSKGKGTCPSSSFPSSRLNMK